MTPSTDPDPEQGLTVRRARLVDVPAVARLIDGPAVSEAASEGVADSASATRLLLAHHGLESDGFWVAVDRDGEVRAAAVLLPPGSAPGDAGRRTVLAVGPEGSDVLDGLIAITRPEDGEAELLVRTTPTLPALR